MANALSFTSSKQFTKDRTVEVSVALLAEIGAAIAKGRIPADERNQLVAMIGALITPKYDYEVEPTKVASEGGTERCTPTEATQWSVYRRLRDRMCLAEWVADCLEKDVAMSLAAALRLKQDGVSQSGGK